MCYTRRKGDQVAYLLVYEYTYIQVASFGKGIVHRTNLGGRVYGHTLGILAHSALRKVTLFFVRAISGIFDVWLYTLALDIDVKRG